MTTNRDKRLERAQMRCLFTVPFFAPGVAKLPVVWDERIPTACTDGKEIRWNGDWFDSLKDPELVTVLCHEVCHCMFGHLWRAPGGVDWDCWNQATDHAVNLMLKEFGAQVLSQNKADPFPFPDPQDSYCADPAFAGLAEEVIYDRLSKRPKSPQGNPGGNKVGGGGQTGAGQGAGKQGGGKSGGSQPHSMPSFGQISQPPQTGAAAVQAKHLRNDWEGTFVNACQQAQQRGELPAGLARLVDNLVASKVPWSQILRSWLREQCSDDYNFLEPSMEYSESGFILPSLKSEKMGPVVFATDTSGSINDDLLRQYQSEKQSCLDEMRPSKLVDIYCDAAIHKVAEYQPGDEIGLDAPGGGGTDFRPVFEHCAKMDVAPRCIVYLTDLEGSFPEDPGVPTIWVTWAKDGKAPFGEVVYADK